MANGDALVKEPCCSAARLTSWLLVEGQGRAFENESSRSCPGVSSTGAPEHPSPNPCTPPVRSRPLGAGRGRRCSGRRAPLATLRSLGRGRRNRRTTSLRERHTAVADPQVNAGSGAAPSRGADARRWAPSCTEDAFASGKTGAGVRNSSHCSGVSQPAAVSRRHLDTDERDAQVRLKSPHLCSAKAAPTRRDLFRLVPPRWSAGAEVAARRTLPISQVRYSWRATSGTVPAFARAVPSGNCRLYAMKRGAG